MGSDSVTSAMQALKVVLVVLLSLSCAQAAKKSKLRYDKKEMKSCRGDLDAIKPKIAQLRADLELVHKCMNTSRTDANYHTYCVSPPESFSSTGNQVPSGLQLQTYSPSETCTSQATQPSVAHR